MNSLTLILDLDDVLENQAELWVEELNRRHQRDVAYEDLDGWNIEPFYPGLSMAEIYAPLEENCLLDKFVCTEYSQEIVRKWARDGHTILVVTATRPHLVNKKFEWVVKNYPEIPENCLICAGDKRFVYGDFIVDDGIHNLLTSTCPNRLIFDRPWNRTFNALNHGMHRVRNFVELDDAVTFVAKTGERMIIR